MAIDFREIQLTECQQRHLAELAERSGKPWDKVLQERLVDVGPIPGDKTAGEDDVEYIEDFESWLAHFQEWIGRQGRRNPSVDDRRESIYPDRW